MIEAFNVPIDTSSISPATNSTGTTEDPSFNLFPARQKIHTCRTILSCERISSENFQPQEMSTKIANG